MNITTKILKIAGFILITLFSALLCRAQQYALTQSVPDTVSLQDVVANTTGGVVADWHHLKHEIQSGRLQLDDFYNMIGLGEQGSAMVVLGGRRYSAGNRQYFIQRFDRGPYSGFLVHDRIGSLYLGSWYGFNMPILARAGGNQR